MWPGMVPGSVMGGRLRWWLCPCWYRAWMASWCVWATWTRRWSGIGDAGVRGVNRRLLRRSRMRFEPPSGVEASRTWLPQCAHSHERLDGLAYRRTTDAHRGPTLKAFNLILRLILGGVFIAAGVLKIWEPAAFAADI